AGRRRRRSQGQRCGGHRPGHPDLRRLPVVRHLLTVVPPTPGGRAPCRTHPTRRRAGTPRPVGHSRARGSRVTSRARRTRPGPPVMDPMSGPPGYGAPYSGVPDYGAPKPKRGIAVPLFAGLTALFFIAAAVLGGLYFAKSGAYDKKVSDLKPRDAKISAQSG